MISKIETGKWKTEIRVLKSEIQDLKSRAL